MHDQMIGLASAAWSPGEGGQARRRLRRPIPGAALLIAALVLGGCGSDGGGTASSGASDGGGGEGGSAASEELCRLDDDALQFGGRIVSAEATPTSFNGNPGCEWIGIPSIRQSGQPPSVAVLRVELVEAGQAVWDDAREEGSTVLGSGDLYDLQFTKKGDSTIVLDDEARAWIFTRLSYQEEEGESIEDASELEPSEKHAEALADGVGFIRANR